MQKLKQIDSTGCGIACIAMLANLDYEEVKGYAVNRMGLGKGGDFYADTRHLRELGHMCNLEVGKKKRPFKSFEALPNTAILAINYNAEDNKWHWVVYHRTEYDEYVLDPRAEIKSDKRRDFGRLQKYTLGVGAA